MHKTHCNESLNYTLSILLCTQTRHILVLLGTRFLPSDPFTRALVPRDGTTPCTYCTPPQQHRDPHGLAARHDDGGSSSLSSSDPSESSRLWSLETSPTVICAPARTCPFFWCCHETVNIFALVTASAI